MARFLIRRLLLMVPIALGAVTLIFFLLHAIPGDPVDLMLGERAAEADRMALRSALHLDQPRKVQYQRFITALVHGDLGESFSTQKPVAAMILERYPATLALTLAAMVIALGLAVPLGVAAAVYAHSAVDRGILFFSVLGTSLPNFLLGPLLMILFSLKLGWFPVSGRQGVVSLVLPALTLGMGMSAILVRMIRASLLEVIRSEFVTTARAKGLPEWQVILKHACRSALIPLLTLIGLQVGALLTGAIITETIFAWPGLGRLTLQAISSRDYPLAQGCILVIVMTYLCVNLLVDLVYAVADPRIRIQS